MLKITVEHIGQSHLTIKGATLTALVPGKAPDQVDPNWRVESPSS